MTVTRLPRGTSKEPFLGGSGILIPFRNDPTRSSAQGSTSEPPLAASGKQPLDLNETYSPDHPRYAEAVQENPMLPVQNGLERALRKGLEESNPGFKVDPRTGELVPLQSQP